MQPRLEATLADFVPALRFLSPDRVNRHLGHPDLPPAWWTSVPVSRAVDAIGAAELPTRLADLSYAELRHMRLGDLLPAAWVARNEFKLSQWPDGARTDVLVRTPDWADLLTATVQEIGDWTQIGTSTVRPVITQLFAEVLGLLPADERTGVAIPAVRTEDAAPAREDARPDASDEAPAATAAEAAPDEPADAAADDEDAPKKPRGVRMGKRGGAPVVDFLVDGPGLSAHADADDADEDTGDTGDTDEGSAGDDSGLEPVSDLLDAIEDELRPVTMPPPPTGDLAAVVRWLAEEAPDVPLMSELARVTLETTAVVGADSAPPEVRAALQVLMGLVPETLLPEGLDFSDDALEVPGTDLEDPYDAPEMTVMLSAAARPAVRADRETYDTADDKADSTSGDASDRASGRSRDDGPADDAPGTRNEAASASPFVGADDLTVFAMPAARPVPPLPVDEAEDEASAAWSPSSAAPASDDAAAQAPAPAAEAGEDAVPDPVDAFGEVPPVTREDMPAMPQRAPEPAPADPDVESIDAFGEVPPMTRDDVPILGKSRAPAAAAEATVFVPAANAAEAPESSVPEAALPTAPVARPKLRKRKPTPTIEEAEAAAAAADSAAYPPRPSAPPPIPPMPSTPPPGSVSPHSVPADSVPVDEAETVDADPDDTSVPAPGNIVMVLAAWFAGREPRWRTLARDRMFTDSPRDLDSLAAEFGKSPAEVEALETALRRHLEGQLAQPGGGKVRAHLRQVQDDLGPVATVAELRDADSRHTATVPGLNVQLWQVVRGLLDLHTTADGWVVAGAPGELASRTSEIVGGACERAGAAGVPLSLVDAPLRGLGIRSKVQEPWIARLDGFRVADGVVRLWQPAEAAPAASSAPEPVSDPDAEATVEVASAVEPRAAAHDASPADSARCFRDERGLWWYRVDVDTGLLDGEHLPLPAAFVTALGLRPGGSVRLHHAAGPAALRWEDHPYCVSLRTVLTGIGAEAGDMVFIGSVSQGRLETRLLDGDGKLRLPRWARALRHTGVDPVPDQVNLPALLGARLGLPDGCDLKDVLKRLQERGDTDVLELLGVAPSR